MTFALNVLFDTEHVISGAGEGHHVRREGKGAILSTFWIKLKEMAKLAGGFKGLRIWKSTAGLIRMIDDKISYQTS